MQKRWFLALPSFIWLLCDPEWCPGAGVAVDQLEAAAAAAGKPRDGEGAPRNVARSSTTLLAKNLPWTVTEEELQVRSFIRISAITPSI